MGMTFPSYKKRTRTALLSDSNTVFLKGWYQLPVPNLFMQLQHAFFLK